MKLRFAPDTPVWLRLTVRAGLREAYLIRTMRRYRFQQVDRLDEAKRLAAINDPSDAHRRALWRARDELFDEGRRRRQAGREINIAQQVESLRRQAAVEAYKAGVREEAWRRVWKPIAFSDPVFTETHARYVAIDLEALSRDWRAELKRLEGGVG